MGRQVERKTCLEQQQLWPGSGPLAVAVAGKGRADANLHAVRQHGGADFRKLEEVVLKIGLGLSHRHAILQVLCLV